MTFPLEHNRRHEALDLGGFELGLLALLDGQGPLDDVLANVVELGQVEQLADLGGALGSQTAGNGVVGEAGDLVLALLHDHHGDDGEVAVDNAAANRLALAFTGAALTVAGVALGQ